MGLIDSIRDCMALSLERSNRLEPTILKLGSSFMHEGNTLEYIKILGQVRIFK